MNVLKPKIFKSKKFVVDCQKVYAAFFNNYRAMAAALQQMVPDSSAESCLRHMTDMNLLLSASFMSCICTILSIASSELQRFDGLINDLFNNYTALIEKLSDIRSLLLKQEFKNYLPLKRFSDMLTALDKGEFQGVPIIGRNSILRHHNPLINENMFSKFENYVSAVMAGFIRRMARTIDDHKLQSYAGFLNTLMGSLVPHTFSIEFNPVIIGEILAIPSGAINSFIQRFCNLLIKLPSKSKTSFNKALRCILVNASSYRDFPHKSISGLIDIVVIPVSEAIAETHGSLIDELKLRYCNTDANYNRLQNELKIKLMGPPPCTDSAENLINKVARRMTEKHNFITSHNNIGAAMKNYRKIKYSLPFSF